MHLPTKKIAENSTTWARVGQLPPWFYISVDPWAQRGPLPCAAHRWKKKKKKEDVATTGRKKKKKEGVRWWCLGSVHLVALPRLLVTSYQFAYGGC
jgi:hypothetical protein